MLKEKNISNWSRRLYGSHLTESLLNLGCEVKALSYYNSFGYDGWLEKISHENLEIISGDIRDPFFVIKLQIILI